MTTIRMLDPKDAQGSVKEMFDTAFARAQKFFNAKAVPNVWRAQGHCPQQMEANWKWSETIMRRGDLKPLVKEHIAVCVAIVTNCTYCVDAHVAAAMKFGLDEKGVSELLAVTENAYGLAMMAETLSVKPDFDAPASRAEASLFGMQEEKGASENVAAVYGEIREFSLKHLRMEEVPTFWKVLGQNDRYLETTWAKDKAIMGPGILSIRDKSVIGLAVSMAAGGRYFTEYYARMAQQAGLTHSDLIQVAAEVHLNLSFNKIAQGMQIESDLKPYTD